MSTAEEANKDALPDAKLYSHSFQFVKNKTMGFDSPFFGLCIDRTDLTSLLFSKFDPQEGISYRDSLNGQCRERMDRLQKEEFTIQIIVGENVYPATNATENPRLWEAGKIAQHFDFQGLEFEGIKSLDSSLSVVVWPDSFTFKVDIKGSDENGLQPLMEGFDVKIQFQDWVVETSFDPRQTPDQKEFSVNLACNLTSNLDQLENPEYGVDIDTVAYSEVALKTNFNKDFNCFFTKLGVGTPRPFKGMWTDIRDYDEIGVTIQNKGSSKVYVPIVLYIENLANPTGVCAIVCDEKYRPTGIPIQVSKNWHMEGIPAYGYFYSYLPVNAGATATYQIRLVYGFYGSLPSASHGNLSLVGWGKKSHGTRWEQLAIGCFGETICLDPDFGLVPLIITDLRTLMVKREDKDKWRFSDAGWGGDWLKLSIKGQRLTPFQWRFGYFSHGPCLSEVNYKGWYGKDKAVSLEASVSTLRTDDYARTFFNIRYDFNTDTHTDLSFFELGTTDTIHTPTIAWGNNEGLIEERDLDRQKPNHLYIEQQSFDGAGPFWFGFPKQELPITKGGKGWRAIVIRSFEASFGGVRYHQPTFSVINIRRNRQNIIDPNAIFALRPPPEVTRVSKGDWVSLDISVIALPRKVDDYYGPNMSFHQHMAENPDSWKTIHREAAENVRSVDIHSGGKVVSIYPIIVSAVDQEMIKLVIQGGLGAVPIQFNGLLSRHYMLFRCTDEGELPIDGDQAVHGNDFYQVEYHHCRIEKNDSSEVAGYYCITFNVILDEIDSSIWVLRRVGDDL